MATKRQCLRALELNEETLSGYKNVVGLGVVPLEIEKKGRRECAIAVYVSSIERTKGIPPAVHIRGKKGDVEVPIRIIETGEISLESDEFRIE